ncbi:hypothetical protein PSACC_02461, partial [Paramicrosporidium saccamoebae]
AFKNVYRKLQLEPGQGKADHVDLDVEAGDLVMVLLPSKMVSYRYDPYVISATANDYDVIDEHLIAYLSDGKISAVAARIQEKK